MVQKTRQRQLFTGGLDVLGTMRLYVNGAWCYLADIVDRVTNLEDEIATTVGEPRDFVADFDTELD